MKAIAAINRKGYIGKDGKLMWKSTEDFKHFKSKTMGGICIVGLVTWEKDLGGKALPGRDFVVVGQDNKSLWTAVKEAIALQFYYEKQGEFKDIWVIGGASIYQQLWPLIEEMHLSIINDDQEGDRKLNLPENFLGKVYTYNFEPNKKEAV